MLMVHTLVSAQWVGQNHDPNVPLSVRVQVLFEFLLYHITHRVRRGQYGQDSRQQIFQRILLPNGPLILGR